jgi:tripartite ATP-independent transporter DctM subunit
MPVFAAIGGIATVMLNAAGQEPEAFHIPVFDTLTSPELIAIPLFTLTGFFLSESKAGERLVRTFQVFFSWLPGGVIIVAVLISAFFSSFTGASGVTILALGGILFTIFKRNGYSESTAIGLLTASGGTGVMFPPSLAIILVFSTSSTILHFMNVSIGYSVVQYFAGAVIPGIILVAATITTGMLMAYGSGASGASARSGETKGKVAFTFAEAFGSVRESFLEIMLPLVLIVGFFTGRLTLMEASAVSVIYVVIVEVFVKRDIALRDAHKVFAKAIPVIGGVLVILAMASGLSYAFVFSGIPDTFASWMEDTINSRLIFLLLLNLALLLVGCVVDMFSAIMVLLPLVVPLGYVYGIDPLHLGIIFILNLEAGFLTPPVGINLFLASSRFEKPFMSICAYVLPFFVVRIAVLLLVAYIPWFSTWLPSFLK